MFLRSHSETTSREGPETKDEAKASRGEGGGLGREYLGRSSLDSDCETVPILITETTPGHRTESSFETDCSMWLTSSGRFPFDLSTPVTFG